MNTRIVPAPPRLSEPMDETLVAPQNDLAELALAARRQAKRIAFAGAVGLCVGMLHYATSPKEFRATSTILIEERQSDLEQEIAATLPSLRSDASITNQVQILNSLGLAIEVARALDLQTDSDFLNPPQSLLGRTIGGTIRSLKALIPSSPAPETAGAEVVPEGTSPLLLQTASRLSALTDVTRSGRSFVVSISHSSHDPVLATEIVNAYAEAYLADGIAANVEASERIATWMEAQIAELRLSALEAAAEAEAFRAEFGATDQQGLRERQERAETLNTLLGTFQARFQEIALSSTFPSTSGRILSQAIVPRDPTSPSAVQDIGAGLVLGLLIGLGFAVRREARETGFRTGADVARALSQPFLGYMPTISNRRLKRAKPAPQAAPGPRVAFANQVQAPASSRAGDMPALMSRHAGRPQTPSVEPSSLLSPRNLMVPIYGADSEADHALRRLHSMMDGARRGPGGHIVGVAGLVPGDGATFVAANLAHTAARAGRATLLIDGDFAASGLSRALKAADASGLVDILDCVLPAGEAIRRVATTGLDMLPTGLGPRKGGVIEASYITEFGALVGELAGVYDTIIVDLPPLAQFPEAESLVAQIDRVILTVPWGRVPRAAVSSFLDSHPVMAARCMGVVTTETDMRKLEQYGEQCFTAQPLWSA